MILFQSATTTKGTLSTYLRLAHELKTLQLTMRHPLIAACANFHPVFLENTHSCSIYVSFDSRELDSYLTYLL